MGQSIAACVKNIIDHSPFISEMLIQDIISFSNLAKFIQPRVQQMYSGSVSTSAIVMAIRRYAEELKARETAGKNGKIDYEILMKTNIYDVNFRRSDEFIPKLESLYKDVHPDEGDFINLTIGSHEITLAVSENCRKAADAATEGMEVVHTYTDLVALTIVFHGDFLQTPGIVYLAIRKLAWEHINIIEIVSTMNVLTFIVSREDSHRAYQALEAFLDEEL